MTYRRMKWWRELLLAGVMSVSCVAIASPDPVTILRAKYLSLKEPLHKNQFMQPLVLDSFEMPSHVKGDIYATVDYPFGAVSTGLNNPDHWCDVMLLHINTKYCHAVIGASATTLLVNIGKKTPEDLADAPRIAFDYNVAAATPGYFEIVLHAKDGPLGTSDYRILMEALALPDGKTFLHLTYSYAINFAGRLAMQTYLGTLGSGKVGFTVIGRQADGQPDYIGGVRGLVERNTMRYYLAIDTFLGSATIAPAAQFEKRLQSWFTAVEQYPRQLHEMDRGDYLDMKHAEYRRQQTTK